MKALSNASLERCSRDIPKLMNSVIDNSISIDNDFALLLDGHARDIDVMVNHEKWVGATQHLIVQGDSVEIVLE